MIIKKAVLHILDFNSNVSVFSQKQLEFSDDSVSSYLQKHIEKMHKDSGKKSGKFNEESYFSEYLKQYTRNEIEFVDFSSWIGNVLYERIALSDKLCSADLIVVDYIYEDVTYFGVLLIHHKTAFTHQVINDENGVYNQLIKHYAILPNSSQRVDAFAIINTDDFKIEFVDKKRVVDGKEELVLPEILLECSSDVSVKEAVKIVKEITTQVAEEYGSNSAIAVSKAKNYMVENSEMSESFSPIAMGEEVFSDSPIMQQEFEKRIVEKELPKDIKLERSSVVKASRNHKIKTDTGIEITVPVEYFEDERYIEFINNTDGTISIELKNIGKITNR